MEKSGNISNDEIMRLKDEIETKDNKPKVTNSVDVVQNEIKRMKIVNNRESLWEDKGLSIYYVISDNGVWVREKITWYNMVEIGGTFCYQL